MNRDDGRVLVVDDDQDLLETIALILEEKGYDIATAASGDEALARLREGPRPSLVLLDLMMPGMNGWTLRQKLLDNPAYKDIPVVVLSGDHAALRTKPPPHCTCGLAKPIALATLLRVVEEGCTASG